MASSNELLALIAGSSQMPLLVARQARSEGRRVLAVGLRTISDPRLDDEADEVNWLDWADVPAFLQLLERWQARGVRQAVMAGKVEQQRAVEASGYGGMEAILDDLPSRHTDALIGAVADILQGAGIELLDSTRFLRSQLATAGMLGQRSVSASERRDIDHGWRVAKTLGRLDIGQTVIVKNSAVVAVEAMEGTDECIRRAAALVGEGTVVVKAAKPDQDLRFDVPVVGAETVETMIRGGSTALAIEAGITVLLDREAMVRRADVAGIAVVAKSDP